MGWLQDRRQRKYDKEMMALSKAAARDQRRSVYIGLAGLVLAGLGVVVALAVTDGDGNVADKLGQHSSTTGAVSASSAIAVTSEVPSPTSIKQPVVTISVVQVVVPQPAPVPPNVGNESPSPQAPTASGSPIASQDYLVSGAADVAINPVLYEVGVMLVNETSQSWKVFPADLDSDRRHFTATIAIATSDPPESWRFEAVVVIRTSSPPAPAPTCCEPAPSNTGPQTTHVSPPPTNPGSTTTRASPPPTNPFPSTTTSVVPDPPTVLGPADPRIVARSNGEVIRI